MEISVSRHVAEDQESHLSSFAAENVLEKYWKRQKSLENISFIDICEGFEYSGKQTIPSSSSGSQVQFHSYSRLASRKVLVLCGEDIPDITSQPAKDGTDYYYTALLTLFKPHRESTLLIENHTPLASYRSFIRLGDSDHVRQLKKYEEQLQDYYKARKRSSGADEESPEEELVRTRAPATTSWVPDADVADNIPHENTDDQTPDDRR